MFCVGTYMQFDRNLHYESMVWDWFTCNTRFNINSFTIVPKPKIQTTVHETIPF